MGEDRRRISVRSERGDAVADARHRPSAPACAPRGQCSPITCQAHAAAAPRIGLLAATQQVTRQRGDVEGLHDLAVVDERESIRHGHDVHADVLGALVGGRTRGLDALPAQ